MERRSLRFIMIYICDNQDHLHNQRSIFLLILNRETTKISVVSQFGFSLRLFAGFHFATFAVSEFLTAFNRKARQETATAKHAEIFFVSN